MTPPERVEERVYKIKVCPECGYDLAEPGYGTSVCLSCGTEYRKARSIKVILLSLVRELEDRAEESHAASERFIWEEQRTAAEAATAAAIEYESAAHLLRKLIEEDER